jgi:hypothetical protein
VLLERRFRRRFRFVDGLDHGARALSDRLVVGAIGEPVERGAIAARRDALQRAIPASLCPSSWQC